MAIQKIDLSKYKAILLAGGKGTRLYPITLEIPKPLLTIKKKPIINYTVDLLLQSGIKDIAVLVSNEFADDFQWWKKRFYAKKSIKIVKENEPLGTFGGVFLLKKWIGKNNFFLINADDLIKMDFGVMAEFHCKTKAPATVGLVKVADPQSFGVVVTSGDFVKEFVEKPEKPISNNINSGYYLFSSEIFSYHPGPKFVMVEKEIFPQLAKENKLAGFKIEGNWMDIGTWERYEKAIKNWK